VKNTEIFYAALYQLFEVRPGEGAQIWQIPIPADRSFLLDNISIMGLSSNLKHGLFALQDASMGRFVLELPLVWWAVRPRRAMATPWVFKPASTLRLSLAWGEPFKPALDLLGNPRPIQKVYVILQGRNLFQW